MEMINKRIPSIIIPINEESEELLFRNINSDKGLYYILPISREDLDILQEYNFFEKINYKFNLNIDEYEEEIIELYRQEEIMNFLQTMDTSDCYICDFYREKISFFLSLSLSLRKTLFIYL